MALLDFARPSCKPKTVSLSGVAGDRRHQQRLGSVDADERVLILVWARQAITILKVNTANQHQTVKLIQP